MPNENEQSKRYRKELAKKISENSEHNNFLKSVPFKDKIELDTNVEPEFVSYKNRHKVKSYWR